MHVNSTAAKLEPDGWGMLSSKGGFSSPGGGDLVKKIIPYM